MKEITVKTNLSVSAPVSICPECFEKNRELYRKDLIIYCEHFQAGGRTEVHQFFDHNGVLVNEAGKWFIVGPISKIDFINQIKNCNDDSLPF